MIAMDGFHQLDCSLGPDGPLPQKSADKAQLLIADAEFRHQIGNDIVVVAGVQSYFASPAALRDTTNHIQCLITIERGHLNCADTLDLTKFSPEGEWQLATTHGGLQVETAQRQLSRDVAAMGDEFLDSSGRQRAQTEQA